MHGEGQWGGDKELADSAVLYHEVLQVELEEKDDKEPPVAENAGEDIELTTGHLAVSCLVENN